MEMPMNLASNLHVLALLSTVAACGDSLASRGNFQDAGSTTTADAGSTTTADASAQRGHSSPDSGTVAHFPDAGAPATQDGSAGPACPESVSHYCAMQTCPPRQLSGDPSFLDGWCPFSFHIIQQDCNEGTQMVAMGVDGSFYGFYDASGQLIALGGFNASVAWSGCTAGGASYPSFTGCQQKLFAICDQMSDGGQSARVVPPTGP
jgi:hypothetical protein